MSYDGPMPGFRTAVTGRRIRFRSDGDVRFVQPRSNLVAGIVTADVSVDGSQHWKINGRDVELCPACGAAKYVDARCPQLGSPSHGAQLDDEPSPAGVWFAIDEDGGLPVPFATEIDALRHAVDYRMKVRFIPYGEVVSL